MIDLLPLNGAGIYATDNNTHGMNITNNTVNGTRDGISIEKTGNTVNMATNCYIIGNRVVSNVNGMWIRLSDSNISNNTANNNMVSGMNITVVTSPSATTQHPIIKMGLV